MKKLLLCSAAVVGVAFSAAPAAAQIDVTIGGHTKNYVGWADQDERRVSTSEANPAEARSFDMLRESEIHVNAEGVADNGLTYGFHVEIEADGGDDANTMEESYLYLSSNLGRVNLGSEDGANYLLQVAAPSADANIDGIRQYIQPVNYGAAAQARVRTPGLPVVADVSGGIVPVSGAVVANGINDADDAAIATVTTLFSGGIDYENAVTGTDEKITYLSPVWSGFQFGASYTPDVQNNAAEDINSANGLAGFSTDNVEDNLDDAWEAAVRYEGQFNNVGFAIGAGYTDVGIEADRAGNTHDDVEQWNVGLDLNIGAFGLGGVWTETDNLNGLRNVDSETYVLGADYTTGPFQLGISYLNNEVDLPGAGQDVDTDRYTGGVIYTAAPGLSFRGSISHIEHDFSTPTNIEDIEATSVLGGIQLNF